MSESTAEKDRTRFWQRRALRHLPEMRAAKAAGLFPKREGWRNVPAHGLVEGERIDVLAEALNLPEQTRRHMETAGNLHDVGKRRQIELYNQQGPAGAREAENQQAVFLENSGFPSEVIRLTKFMGGLSPLEMVEDPKANQLKLKDDLDLPVLICHYVDDITLHDRIVPLKERIAYVKERYKVEDEEGVKRIGKPYSDIQLEVSRQIEQKLAKMLGVDPPEKLPEWIKGKIKERIEQEGIEEVCLEAAKATYKVHQELGERGKEQMAKNQFGETTLIGDWECEEAVIETLRKSGLPVRLTSEEHGELVISEGEAKYLAVLDGLDGTYQYKSEPSPDRRYGTMFAIFDNSDPKYKDAMISFIMEHPTGRLFLAVRGKGITVIDMNTGKKTPIDTSSITEFRQDLRVFVDEGYGYNRLTFSKKLRDQGLSPRSTHSSCRYYADLVSGHADVVCECTRKRNLELAAAYLLVKETGGVIIKLEDGKDLGDEKYFDYGQEQEDYRGIISAATLKLAKAVRKRCQASSG